MEPSVGTDIQRRSQPAVLVIGGGVAGIQAALDLGDMGMQVHLVEKKPSIGGRMAQLDKTFPTNDCSLCILSPKMAECSRHPNVTLHTNSEVVSVAGSAGAFNQLYGVHFPTDMTGYAVGFNAVGTVLRTDDGGVTWQPQVSNAQFRLNGVHFVDAQRGWAVGASGVIIHTGTGGEL